MLLPKLLGRCTLIEIKYPNLVTKMKRSSKIGARDNSPRGCILESCQWHCNCSICQFIKIRCQ